MSTRRFWWRRLRQWLPRRFGRQLAIVALVAGLIATSGHFLGGLIGWWHAAELVLGRRDAAGAVDARDGRGASSAPPLSIVVLPFDDGVAANETWFFDNLTSDVALELSRIPGSSVIAREAAMRYRGDGVDPRQVARELGVRYVLAGSGQMIGDKVRLRVRLIDGTTGEQRWADRFDMSRAALPALADQLAARLARAIDVQMIRADGHSAARLPPDRVRADDLAMQGFGLLHAGLTPDTNRAAMAHFDRAVEMDPRSVRGWGGVLISGVNRFRWEGASDALRKRVELAADHLERLEPDGYHALLARIVLRMDRNDMTLALAAADRLVERFPGHQVGHMWRGLVLSRIGRFEEALEATDRSLALLPQDPDRSNKWRRSFILYALGRHAEATEVAREVVAAMPKNNRGPSTPTLIAALHRDGRTDEARRLLADYRQAFPEFGETHLLRILAGQGERFVAARDDLVRALRELGMR